MNKCLTRPNRSVAGIALVVAAVAFWGMSGIFVTFILQNSGGTSVSLAFWGDTASFGIFLGVFHIFYNQIVMVNGAFVTTVLQAAMPGIVTVAAFYLWKEELTRQPLPLNPAMGVAFLGLVTISTFGAFTLYLLSLKKIQAGVASMIAMSEILFAGSYAWFLFNERFTTVQGAGAFLVIAGAAWLFGQKVKITNGSRAGLNSRDKGNPETKDELDTRPHLF